MHSLETVVAWINRITENEGGYQKRHSDRGNWTSGRVGEGELKGTKYGIAAMTYPHLDIEHLTVEHAAELYIADYLVPLRADRFEDGVAYQLLDFAVHSGQDRAIRSLQKAVGAVADGKIGPATQAAMARYSEARIIMKLNGVRLRFFARQPAAWLAEYGRGLMNRIADQLDYGAEDAA